MQAKLLARAARLFIFAVFLVLLANSATAQVEQGRIVGRIVDPQDASIVGASIKLTNLGTNIVQAAVTDQSGNFVITPVKAGTYALSVMAAGFDTMLSSQIQVQVGEIVRQDLRLRVGSSTTTIEVTTGQQLLTTDSATVGQVITNQQLSDLPLNGRGFFRLAELTPGAALLPPTGNSLAIRPEIVDGNTISGIRGSATSFLMDGVDVSEQHQGGTFIQTSIDALREFSIQQSPYSSEYNRGGAFFNATVKSGTNRFHGGLFEFIRNDKLDARNFFALTRQILKRNQFGGDLGGPLTIPHVYNGKDRTFFFFNFEGQRLRQGLVFNSTVPSDAQRGGNFGAKPIKDPTTGVPFFGNTIPTNRITSQARAILAYIPHQNTSTGTFSYAPSQAVDFNQYTVRLDHQVTTRNSLFARWIYVQNREVDPNASPLLGKAYLTSIGQDIAAGLISTVSSNKVNEVRAHFLPSHVRLTAFLPGPDYNAQFGVAGFTAQLRPGSGGSFPDYSWSGYSSLSGSTFDQRPKSQDRRAIEVTENFTYLKDRQSLKFGTLIRYYQWLGFDSGTYAGQFSFNGAQSGDAYADFLLGYPSAVTRAYPADNFGGQQWYKQFFVQDDVRVSDRLTLNVGLRYEYSPWLGGYKGQIGTFDPTRSQPIIVSGSGLKPDLTSQHAAPNAYAIFGKYIQTSETAGLPSNITYTDKHQFGPRLGVSFRASPKTVIRGGFGMFYEPEGTSGRVNLSVLPFRLSETQNQNTVNGVPTRTLADFFLGAALGSAQANPSLSPTKVHMNIGYNEHYSLGVQQQLTSKDVLEVGYVGNHGVDLNGNNDFNDPAPGPNAVVNGVSQTIQLRRPYQPFSTISFNTQDTSTNYNSLQVKYDHRLSHGLTALVAYTYSKFMQFNQAPALGGNIGYEYAVSPFDIPHNLAISGTYELPVGRGKKLLGTTNRAVDSVLGGWHLQTIVVHRSGTPYTPVVSGDRANTGVGGQRPNLNPAGGNPNYVRTLSSWFDKSRYIGAPTFTYGNIHANTLRSDNYRQYDASVFKNFSLPGEGTLSFRAEFFNISNTTSFNAPNATIDATAGGSITSTSVPSRDIQFALKYNF
jgi:hypothetical protein